MNVFLPRIEFKLKKLLDHKQAAKVVHIWVPLSVIHI